MSLFTCVRFFAQAQIHADGGEGEFQVHYLRESASSAGNSGFGCGWPRWEIRGSNVCPLFSGERRPPLGLFSSAISATARAMKPNEITAQISVVKSSLFQHPDSQHLAHKRSHRAPTTGPSLRQSIYHLAFIIYTFPQSPLTKIRTYG
jgi:hypothetical protein